MAGQYNTPQLQPTQPKPAPWTLTIPSTVLQDSIQYVHTVDYQGRRRAWGRWFILVIAVAALGGLTSARYLSSEELSSGFKLRRELEPKNAAASALLRGSCRCKERFMSWIGLTRSDPTVSNLTQPWYTGRDRRQLFFAAQCKWITGYPYDFSNQTDPTHLVTLGDVDVMYSDVLTDYIGRYDILNDTMAGESRYRLAVRKLCADSLDTFFTQFVDGGKVIQGSYSSMAAIIDFGYPLGGTIFSSDVLMTASQLDLQWRVQIQNSVNNQIETHKAALRAETATAIALSMRLNGSYKTDYTEESPINLPSFSQELELTTSTLEDLLERGSVENFEYDELADSLATFINKVVYADYPTYVKVCAADYCDFIDKKSVIDRLVEFLATIGGLWTVIIGCASTVWACLGFLNLLGRQHSGFYVMHSTS